jgi:hypothetical protein
LKPNGILSGWFQYRRNTEPAKSLIAYLCFSKLEQLMFLTTIALLVATLLCFAFDPTKLSGVAGVVLLFYLYPLSLTVLFVLGGVAFLFIRYYQWRKCHALPKLPDGRD